MSRKEQALALVLNAAHWELDDAAHDIQSGRYSIEQCEALATNLSDIVRILHERVQQSRSHTTEAQPCAHLSRDFRMKTRLFELDPLWTSNAAA